ncbi:zinc ribbon domain-containing protein [Paraburkholderia piptadeniae]|uniref:zinc ribbon domain-containing protein n=1 Tax=Paraburkholderia piptadeniae TaxID=1701573 RepID=UPI000B401118|nr:zinc ribbon domain-containing protein [Paraburkholderia piptadeniae]
MRFSNCGSENPVGAKFCKDCGAKLSQRCPNCGHESSPADKFCNECGSSLASALEMPPDGTQRAVSAPIGGRTG